MRIPCAGFLVLFTVCLAGGCGLADYEKRMDAQRARLRVVDEENRYLGEMLELPPPDMDGVAAVPFDFFVRLPRGISPTVADKNGSYVIGDQVVYRYPGSAEGTNVFLAAAVAAAPDHEKKLKKGEVTPEEFREKFQRALGAIVKETLRPSEKSERVTRPATTYTAEKLPSLDFDYFALEDDPALKDATHVAVYVHQRGARLLALAFQVPQAVKTEQAAQQGIDLCLRSLDIGDDAPRKRTAFSTTRRLD
jgi:hypothetical protein